MTTIIDKLAQREGIEHLPGVDPNTQNVAPANFTDKLAQATIPAILAGFYKFSRNEQNASQITGKSAMTNWVEILFGDETKKLTKRIAIYAGVSPEIAGNKMQHTADSAVNILKEDLANQDGKSIKKYFTDQRNNILQHLPAAIEIGNILNDTTLDDRTNKMEGPVSGLMHRIEKTFAATDTEVPEK